MSNKKVLIFGSGAIGSHLGFCLYSAGLNIDFVARGKHYKKIKQSGLLIKIYNKKKLLKKKLIKESQRIKFFSSLQRIKNRERYDYIFIMNKINTIKEKNLKKISSLMNKNTSIIPQCTQMPFWLDPKIYTSKKIKKNKDINFLYNKYFSKENIIGMSAWVSAIIEEPGVIKVRHVQRGYPLKEVNSFSKVSCNFLRSKIKKYCISPKIKNLKGELFIKSLNALAFNLIALNTLKNNKELYEDKISKKKIFDIMKEGDKYLKINKIKIPQTINSRITQTLGSTEHTMSMLSDHLRGKNSEINSVWSSYYNLMTNNNIDVSKTKKIYKETVSKLNK